MKILVLGASGMLGNAMFRFLAEHGQFDVTGTLRSTAMRRYLPESLHDRLKTGIDVLSQDHLMSLFDDVRPDVVINCIGLVKQLGSASDPLSALPVNSLLPHRLDRQCGLAGARLVHFSTDCVFTGDRGMYKEEDTADARDLYGLSKYLGEVRDSSHAITLRTSIIGHELGRNLSLIGWFLSQEGKVPGYSQAIFSGLPTVEMARIVMEYVLPKPELSGLYHVSAAAIDKKSLLELVAEVYGMNVEIFEDVSVRIDRSLDSTQFRKATGYVPPTWPELVESMKSYHEQWNMGDEV